MREGILIKDDFCFDWAMLSVVSRDWLATWGAAFSVAEGDVDVGSTETEGLEMVDFSLNKRG